MHAGPTRALDQHPFIMRLLQHVDLSADDLKILEDLITDEMSVKRRRDLIVNGSEGAVATYRQISWMAENDGVSAVRAAGRSALGRMQRGGHLGLRWELQHLHETRLRLRHGALRKLLVEGGAP